MKYHLLDRLPGLTHSFTGLARGNPHASKHRYRRSHPRQAARECLAKAWTVQRRTNAIQHVLPPLVRPDRSFLRRMGFTGPPRDQFQSAAQREPKLLHRAASSSAMWMANAATPTSGPENGLTVTPANLSYHLHRRLEVRSHQKILRWFFNPVDQATVKSPLDPTIESTDEGQANQVQLLSETGSGVELYVWGRCENQQRSTKYLPRQTRVASTALARRSGNRRTTVLAQQHPDSLEAGVFHNDVIGFGRGGLYVTHEQAYRNQSRVLKSLKRGYREQTGNELQVCVVADQNLSLTTAVETYFFNSQLLPADSGWKLIVANRCQQEQTQSVLKNLVQETDIEQIYHVNLEESLRNGGGPACLSLCLPVDEGTHDQLPRQLRLTPKRRRWLEGWIDQYYPETLVPDQLSNPELYRLSRQATQDFYARFR